MDARHHAATSSDDYDSHATTRSRDHHHRARRRRGEPHVSAGGAHSARSYAAPQRRIVAAMGRSVGRESSARPTARPRWRRDHRSGGRIDRGLPGERGGARRFAPAAGRGCRPGAGGVEEVWNPVVSDRNGSTVDLRERPSVWTGWRARVSQGLRDQRCRSGRGHRRPDRGRSPAGHARRLLQG